LSNVTPGTAALGIPKDATLTIIDDDSQPTVKFSSATYTVNEGAGTATIIATLSSASSLPVTVNYATSNGTASAGSDYTAATATLTFAPGETSKSFTVAITADTLDETDEVVNLKLSTPTGAPLGVPSNATLTIADDDAEPTVQFEINALSENENSGLVELVVTLSSASGKLVTVNYTSGNGTATAEQDYASASGTLTFAPGETSQVVELNILNDTAAESSETVIITLSTPTGATLGTQPTVALTIIDNDTTVNTSFKLYLPVIKK
jgi:large repetitive protein